MTSAEEMLSSALGRPEELRNGRNLRELKPTACGLLGDGEWLWSKTGPQVGRGVGEAPTSLTLLIGVPGEQTDAGPGLENGLGSRSVAG